MDEIDYVSEFSKNIYNIYKVHNSLDLFYCQICLYFRWKLYLELMNSSTGCFDKEFYICIVEKKKNYKKVFIEL